MNFNNHYRLEGLHAFLSASKHHWTNYDDDKLVDTYNRQLAVQRGVALHEHAKMSIDLKVKLPKSRKTLNMYVNDAIGFNMQTEQVLYYSDNCFGTCDCICFKKNTLRIHDLKTGTTPASVKQLEIYTALFCLEYEIRPIDIEMELRLYQVDEIIVHVPEPEDIVNIMNKIIKFDKMITKIKMGG